MVRSTKNDSEKKSSVERALILLEAIAKSRQGITLTDLSRDIALPKTTIFRLLEILTNGGYVQQVPETEKYKVGLKAIEIGMAGLENSGLVDASVPYLQDLSQRTEETTFLAVYNEGDVVYLYKVEGSQSIRTSAELGTRRPAHATALGKAILSNFTMEEVDKILSESGMKQLTNRTITSPVQFHHDLCQIRVNGYAMDDEECELGLTCFAAPVYTYFGKVIGAISVAGPTARMMASKDAFVENLIQCANIISGRLGYVSSMREQIPRHSSSP